MTDEFYNPYHFVPLTEALWTEDADDFRDKAKGPPGHDSYAPGRLSGRLICRLVPETPLVVGARQRKASEDENDYTIVEPYCIDGVPALPATSLKGMVSALLEAASGSAMRIFDEGRPVSYRQPPIKALSALGMIREKNGKLFVQPLTGPTIAIDKPKIFKKWRKLFGGSMPLLLRFGVYPPLGDGKRDYATSALAKSFEGDSRDDIASAPSRKPIYYARIEAKTHFNERGVKAAEDPTELHIKTAGHNRFIIGQRPLDAQGKPCLRARILTKDELDAEVERLKSEPGGEEKVDAFLASFTRGFVRVLGGEDRDMADTKKHELFIPYPEKSDLPAPLPISEFAQARFEALAEEAAKSVKNDVKRLADPGEGRAPNRRRASRVARPFLPFGADDVMEADRKELKDGIWSPHLRQGQIVYFDIEATGTDEEPAFEVSHLSFSAIWRDLVTKDGEIVSRHDLLQEHKELRPYDAKRTKLTPAELMFGFVEDKVANQEEEDEPDRKRHRAYRGRLRFSTGVLDASKVNADDLFQKGDFADDGVEYVRLRELSSPKPPSLQFYLKRRDGEIKPKHTVDANYEIMGRKVYLHHLAAKKGGETWTTQRSIAEDQHPQTGAAKRKLAVRPLDPGEVKNAGGFWFHVDFDNLSNDELNLLCFALRPNDDFRHKLGLGKPLGLGTVRIEPVFFGLVDRQARYGGDDIFLASRFSEIWSGPTPSDIPPAYQTAMATASAEVGIPQIEDEETPKFRASKFRKLLEGKRRGVHDALFDLGEPDALDPQVPVHYPKSLGQADTESDNYSWFVNNEDWADQFDKGRYVAEENQPQRLQPIDKESLSPLRVNRHR